jgi:Uma2 family endonuclease
MVTALPPQSSSYSPTPGVVLQGISWETYQALVRELECQPGQRLTYDGGTLEIAMPLPPHERYKKYLARLVEVVTEELGLEVASLGSCTWSRRDLLKGLEPDECYYIQREAAVRGKMQIDLTVDPPPDLAIEVDITCPSVQRLPIYAALGVPEVWRFDGVQITLLKLIQESPESGYLAIDASVALPICRRDAVQHWLTQAQTMAETSWVKAIRHWARSGF